MSGMDRFWVVKEGWNEGRQFAWQEEYGGIRVKGRKVDNDMMDKKSIMGISQHARFFASKEICTRAGFVTFLLGCR